MEMHSTELGALMEALAKSQAIMLGAVEDSNNPFFKSTYADLTSVWYACREPLTKNGLSVVQTINIHNGENVLVSILGHSSGQWIKSVLPIRPSKPDIQALGSAITYCRRYALAALVGVCPADDDGESTMQREKKPRNMEGAAQIVKPPKINAYEDFFKEFGSPPGLDKERLVIFIEEQAKAFKQPIGAIQQRALENPVGFLGKFEEWEAKCFGSVNDL
jgi:hypothetical protein